MSRPIAIASAVAALACVALVGCGGSDAPSTTAGEAGGGPASTQQRITSDARKVINSNPQLPVCNPGGLDDEDEETCQHFWNHLLAWKTLTDPVQGPVLEGAPSSSASGSMIYAGFTGQLDDEHWYGPNLPEGCAGTGSVKQNASYCKGKAPGLQFGKTTNIETYDNGSETKSTIAWDLSAGDVDFGTEYFMAYNDGGAGGTQYAFCGQRSGTGGGGGQWVSCSRAGDDGDGAKINPNQPAGNDEDYASFGWVVEDYPILIGVQNRMPRAVLTLGRPKSDAGSAAVFSETGSTAGVITGKASLQGAVTSRQALWIAGYRSRVGDSTVSVVGDLKASDSSGSGEAFDGAKISIKVDFAQRPSGTGTSSAAQAPVAPTCEVTSQATAGDNAKCEIIEFVKGGVSAPGVLRTVIYSGSAPRPTS